MVDHLRLIAALMIVSVGCEVAQLPGKIAGRVLLPNGWWLSPVGESIPLGDFPMNAALSPDQGYLAVTNDGMSNPLLLLVDLHKHKVVQSIELKDSWLGITFSGNKLFVSGGNQNCVYVFVLSRGQLQSLDTISFAPPQPKSFAWTAGLDVDKSLLAVVFRGDSTLRYYNFETKRINEVKLDGMPYSCRYLNDGTILVSIWSSHKVEAFKGTRLLYSVETGQHPTEIVISKDHSAAFVANANDNSVTMIDLRTRCVLENISTSLYPESPEGSTTNSVCISNDGRFVLAANADNNSLTLIKVSRGRAVPVGFIPVGWYPTKVLELDDGTVLVLNGKGNSSFANPDYCTDFRHQYIGYILRGNLSYFRFPNPQEIATYTKKVYANTPYHPHGVNGTAIVRGNPVPYKVGGESPIKFVFYFIKENRTYDQVLGDMKEGNGDSSLV